MALSTHSHNQGQKVLKCLALKVLDILIDESCQLRKKSVDMYMLQILHTIPGFPSLNPQTSNSLLSETAVSFLLQGESLFLSIVSFWVMFP